MSENRISKTDVLAKEVFIKDDTFRFGVRKLAILILL